MDASALPAMLQAEPGADAVAMTIANGFVSSVNSCEVVQKARSHGVDVAGLETDLVQLGIEVRVIR